MVTCKVCADPIPSGRHNEYCSKKCQASIEGYGEAYQKKLTQSLSFRPNPIDPVTHIQSTHPIAVFSDIHAPLHSEAWIHRGIQTALSVGAKHLIVNGDFIDANTISRHLGGYYRRKGELQDDLDAGEALIELFTNVFETVTFLSGNHCVQRLTKVFNGELHAERIWKIFSYNEQVKITPRSFVQVNSKVIVGHPRSYSKTRGGLAQKIAQRWQRHVILGHLHHSASTCTLDGNWQAVEVGCMADLPEFEYTTFEINDMPQPMNGFAIVFGDCIVNFDRFTLWKQWGFEDAP